jgi:hypothetical protein
MDSSKYTLVDTTGDDDNRKFVYEDESGKEHTVSLNKMRQVKASYEADKKAIEIAEKLAATFEKLDKAGTAAAEGMTNFLTTRSFADTTL